MRWLDKLTPARCRLVLAAVLLVGFVARFAYLNWDCPIDLSGDEAHYWDWSRQLDWSYYSKGPAVAYVIRFGCWVFGDNELGVRFPALVLAVGTSLCTYWLTARAFGSERLAMGAVLLCHVMPMCIAGSLLMTIDPPYYFGWALATCFAAAALVPSPVYARERARVRGERSEGSLERIEAGEPSPQPSPMGTWERGSEGRYARWPWIAAGVAIGLAFLAKYAALLWLACLLIYLLVDRRQRRWLRSPWPYVTIAVALLFTIPVLIWNAQHDWVTFGHVSRSTTENQSGFDPLRILSNLGLMIGSQVGILNPVVAGFMVGGVFWFLPLRGRLGGGGRIENQCRAAEERTPSQPPPEGEEAQRRSAVLFLLCFGLPFLGFVSIVTLFKEIEPNWPVAAYFTLVPLAAWFVARAWPRTKGWLIGAIAIGLAVIPVSHYSSAFYGVMPVPPKRWDPAARLYGWQEIGAEVSLLLRQSDLHNPFIVSDKYQLASLMAFYVEGQPKTYCLGPYWADPKQRDRLSQFDMWPDRSLEQRSLVGRDAIYVGQDVDELPRLFERVRKLPNLPIERGGVKIREQKLYLCYGFKGAVRPTDGKTKR